MKKIWVIILVGTGFLGVHQPNLSKPNYTGLIPLHWQIPKNSMVSFLPSPFAKKAIGLSNPVLEEGSQTCGGC
jgi:hypothetical protein